jgi:DNA invertase Pin-like site-specific DNA recombinase
VLNAVELQALYKPGIKDGSDWNSHGADSDSLTRFDKHAVSFVSVTQQFNTTTTSMGRLTLNVLLSFAQFEREVTSERIWDKIVASKRKGLWVGGMGAIMF